MRARPGSDVKLAGCEPDKNLSDRALAYPFAYIEQASESSPLVGILS